MLLTTLALAAAVAQAAPTLNYPLGQQFPPVARVGTPFVFDLLPLTFTSTVSSNSNITYSTSTLPAWLGFDASAQTFHGTPSASDIAQTDVTVTATDSTGSTSSQWRVIVTNNTVPGVHSGFSTQIGNPPSRDFASVNVLPGGTGVSIPPYWSFSLGFAADTFRTSFDQPNNGKLYVAARLRGATGLPSWLHFNNDTMVFSGVAPSNGSYTVVATGTDYWGYTGAQTSFVIEVGQGASVEQIKGSNWTDVTTMARNKIDYTLDLGIFTVNGQPAPAGSLRAQLDNAAYPWLSYDSSSRKLSGTVPDKWINGTYAPLSVPFTVSPTNTSSTLSLKTWLGISVLPYLFTTFAPPNITITPGVPFTWSLSPYLQNPTASINVTIPSSVSSWMSWSSKNMSLSGTLPASMTSLARRAASDAVVNVPFTASIGGSTNTATATLKVILSGVAGAPTATSSAAPTNGNGGSGGSGLSNAAKIGLGVGLGLGLLLLLLALLLLCCLRRRRKQRAEDGRRRDNDADSFVAGPNTPAPEKPRSPIMVTPRSGNMMTDIFKFPMGGKSPKSPGHTSFTTNETVFEQPQRMDPLKGILQWSDKMPGDHSPQMERRNSFLVSGDVISVSEPVMRPTNPEVMSAITHEVTSSGSSRASWESPDSFVWSSPRSADGPRSPEEEGAQRHRLSATPSIPRPRDDFTPRYPRNNSPTALARLTSGRHLDSPDFSEFGSPEEEDGDHFSGESGERLDSGISGTTFPTGPSGLSRFESSGLGTDDSAEGDESVVVATAERRSLETRRPSARRQGPRLKPSKEKIASPIREYPPNERSQRALSSGAFADANEARNSTVYAPSEATTTDVQGLGYPASAIYFASPNPEDANRFSGISNRESAYGGTVNNDDNNNNNIRDSTMSDGRASTIRPISPHEHVLSPPLPVVGTFARPAAPVTLGRPISLVGDGRVTAIANETFSIHPQIHPPPTVSLSAATWSSNPPSTYRAVTEDGRQLPSWLHFDARELELWGVPGMADTNDVIVVRIIERLPVDKRRSDPTQYGYEPPQEREVGRITIEVMDRMRSPQFALDGSPHAL